MSNLVKLCLVLVLGGLVVACGGGSSSSGGGGSNNTPDPTSNNDESAGDVTQDEPEILPPTAQPRALQGALFLPVSTAVQWHYDNGDVVSFGPAKQVAGETIYPMQHSLPGLVTEEYFYTKDNVIHFGGLFGNLIELPLMGQLAGEFTFNTLWPVYNEATGRGSVYSCPGKFNSVPAVPGYENFPVPLFCFSAALNRKLVTVPQLGEVPAVGLDLNIGIPTLDGLIARLWLSPGIGIVEREVGVGGEFSQKSTLQRVEGLTAPVIFAFGRGSGLSQNPQQLRWFGEVITSNQWQASIGYATKETDWLQVEYDATGSWRASLVGDELPWGLHAALVTLENNGQTRDIAVSVLVQ